MKNITLTRSSVLIVSKHLTCQLLLLIFFRILFELSSMMNISVINKDVQQPENNPIYILIVLHKKNQTCQIFVRYKNPLFLQGTTKSKIEKL